MSQELAARTKVRLVSLEQEILAATAVSSRTDAIYEQARRAAVAACLECWVFALERGELWTDAVPGAVGIQARRAARRGVGLHMLLGSYTRGRDLLWRVAQEEAGCVADDDLRVVLQQAWAAGESLLAALHRAVEEAYCDEVARQEWTFEERQADLVRRLLCGDASVDLRAIHYDFDGHHLGVIATAGNASRTALGLLAERVGCRLFCLPEQDEMLIGWLRTGRELTSVDLKCCLPVEQRGGVVLAIGRRIPGVTGFCQTYEFAAEAFAVARHRGDQIAWHRDVELDALLLRDRGLARSLIDTYLAPLDRMLLWTVRVYYRGGRNVSASARELGINRSTMHQRLRKVGLIVGRPLESCHGEFELALRAMVLENSETRPGSSEQANNLLDLRLSNPTG